MKKTIANGYHDACTKYSSAAINIGMNGRICGALVQFGCYQHRHILSECVIPRLSLELFIM